MEWDLFLDESGAFERPGEHTLIGGVLINHIHHPDNSMFKAWEKDGRSTLCLSGEYTNAELITGDEWHQLHIKGGKHKSFKQEAQRIRYEEASKQTKYVFDHCCENKSSPKRWRVQKLVLSNYLSNLSSIGGRVVVFDNPEGFYHIDSNTTFMTIFANGILRLYNLLRSEYPNEKTVIYIHAASRLNVTRVYQPDLYATSPLPGDDNKLNMELYINQIKNCVFLNGGHTHLELDGFQQTLESFELLDDLRMNDGKYPHPATVICDYVCNSFFNANSHPEFKSLFTGKSSIILDVFDGPLASEDYADDLAAQNHDWGRQLKALVSCSFPVQRTAEFFDRMGNDKNYNQSLCVKALVDYLYSFVDNRENMLDWADRIKQIIQKTTRLTHQAYLELKANMLIFLHALYTHLSKEQEAQSTARDFVKCVSEITEAQLRNSLCTLYCNRQIVSSTDIFQYDIGERYFEILRDHFDKAIECSDSLLVDFIDMEGLDIIPDTTIEQYGKCIGSYLQLITKHLRSADPNKYEELKSKAKAIIPVALKHFTNKDDISRCHQNLCDLYVELGEYEKAIEHLCSAISDDTSGSFEERAYKVIDVVGNYSTSFVYLHYVNMMHRCFIKEDPHAEILLKCIIERKPTKEEMEALTRTPHPEGIICWHLAASLATNEKTKDIAKILFEASWRSMVDQEAILRTIGIAVRAEELLYGISDKLPGKKESWTTELQRFVNSEYPMYAKNIRVNPFAEVLDPASKKCDINVLRRIADIIAY